MNALAWALFALAGLVSAGVIAVEVRRALQPGSAVRQLLAMMTDRSE